MRFFRVRLPASFLACSLIVGCSGGSVTLPRAGTTSAPGQANSPAPTSTPTQGGTPSSSASPTGGSPTSTPTSGSSSKPTSTPVGPTATPTAVGATPTPTAGSGTPVTAGNVDCTTQEPVPGIYTAVISEGEVTGNTYTQDPNAENEYEVASYTMPTPSPTPTVTPTATPTASASPTITPSPSGTPQMVTLYVGEYTVPSFSGMSTLTNSPAPYTASTTNGCMDVILEQPVGSTAGQLRHRNVASASDNSEALGEPTFANEPAVQGLDIGTINAFTITNLTLTTGTASFTLANGTVGSGNITGSESAIVEPDGTIEDLRGRIVTHVRRAPVNRTRGRI